MRLKCTKKLRSRIGETPEHHDAPGPSVLGDWVGNIVPVMGGEIIVFLNEGSLLTLVLPITALEDLAKSLRQELGRVLRELQVPQQFIVAADSAFSSVRIVPTDSRRMLSLLREVSYYCQDCVDFRPPHRIVNTLEIEIALTEWLHGPEPYVRPIDILRDTIDGFDSGFAA